MRLSRTRPVYCHQLRARPAIDLRRERTVLAQRRDRRAAPVSRSHRGGNHSRPGCGVASPRGRPVGHDHRRNSDRRTTHHTRVSRTRESSGFDLGVGSGCRQPLVQSQARRSWSQRCAGLLASTRRATTSRLNGGRSPTVRQYGVLSVRVCLSHGPLTPANKKWSSASVPAVAHDPGRAARNCSRPLA